MTVGWVLAISVSVLLKRQASTLYGLCLAIDSVSDSTHWNYLVGAFLKAEK